MSGSKLYKAVVNAQSPYVTDISQVWCFIDPSGAGGDEIGWSIGFSAGDFIHATYVGGLTGGLVDANSTHIIETLIEYGVTDIRIESNMGHGLFEINLAKEFFSKFFSFLARFLIGRSFKSLKLRN